MKKTQPPLLALRKEAMGQAGRAASPGGKDNEMNSPLEPPEGNVALLTAWIFVL